MAKVGVVIRLLSGCRPVTSVVVKESTDSDIDDMDNYLQAKCLEHIGEFKKKYVEFNSAEFYIDIVDIT